VYDLAIKELRLIFEFDEAYHYDETVRLVDRAKDKLAKSKGYTVIRVPCSNGAVLSPKLIKKHLK
jgi:very-short-patch-repair endonuclease